MAVSVGAAQDGRESLVPRAVRRPASVPLVDRLPLAEAGRQIPPWRSLIFRIDTDVPEPYKVFWKVQNHGQEARARNALRGQIVPDDGARQKRESTLYTGHHYVECCIVKDGYPERIGYVHIKQLDPEVLAQVAAEGLSFGEAVKRGVCVEPPHGVPDVASVADALNGVDADLFVIVEQDLYPCSPDVPLPIATRTRRLLRGCGFGADKQQR